MVGFVGSMKHSLRNAAHPLPTSSRCFFLRITTEIGVIFTPRNSVPYQWPFKRLFKRGRAHTCELVVAVISTPQSIVWRASLCRRC